VDEVEVREVAVLGLGRMGAAMARRVAGRGHRVRVWNRTAAVAESLADELSDLGVTAARTPAAAVQGADVVLAMLADGDVTCAVLLDTDVLAVLSPGCVVVDLGTSGVPAARRLESGLSAAGVGYLDAPVSGSVPAVMSGSLLVMAGGSQKAVDAAVPVLDSFAGQVLRVGAPGAGQAMKLAVNLVVHDLNAALSESLVLAEKAGIPREAAYDVLQQSVVAAPFVTYKRPAFLDPAAPVAMSLDLVRKDLALITAFASELDSPVAVTAAALAAVEAAVDAGHGSEDMAALSRALES
jgi:3-hydroxyisobutyrate dehydrogenase